MAKYIDLPVYKRALDLVFSLTNSTQKMPKDIRFSRVTKMKNDVMDIAKYIAYANDADSERVAYIEKAVEVLNDIKIDVRSLLDLKYISKAGFSAITLSEAKLSRQLEGWLKSTRAKIESQHKQ